MKRFVSSIFLLLLVVCATAQKEYYTSVDGVKGGAALKTALYNLIKNHKKISYGSGEDKTWGAFYTTDAVIENGKRRVLDMYSPEKRYFGNKGSAISGMNIEHSVPKSWWGGTNNNAYCDLHHLNPSDQTGNSRKSNYPLGELTSETWTNGVASVGKANINGSSANAFEPIDEYKGDFARTYMYMFTCYQDLTWKTTQMNYENSTYPTLKPWAVELLLKWHEQDPVSEKEVNRNNAVYAVQGNRNPFIDYPQLADYVWGDSINYVFHLTGEVENGNGGNTGGDDNNGDGDNSGNDDFEIIDGWKIYLNENFDGSSMKFTTYEGVAHYPWQLSSQYKYAIATSYVNSTPNNAESWLLSPFFDFSNDSVATVSFEYVIRYCETGKAAEHHKLMICNDFDGDVENATWEKIEFGATENTTDWTLTKTGDIEIPQKYMGEKAVTIAFFYKGTETKAGTFEIDNVIVKAIEGANDGGNDVNIYYGELVVGDYTQKSVSISVTETSDSTVDVFFNEVKFAALMPVKIDITVKDVPSRKAGGVLSFSATDIDPYINREAEPEPAYRFASITGTVEDGELILEGRMSDDLMPSRAGKSFSFNGTCSNNDGNFIGGQFVLVTDAAQLTVGDSIVIGYENYVMGVHSDNGKYRTNTDMKTSGDIITYLADDAQIILLEEGVVEGTYAFNVGNGYLAASSSSSNNIATTTTLNENASWKIVINEGDAVITAQGDKTRNILQYNISSPRFSCYKDTQESVNIYAKSPVTTGIEEVDDEGKGQSGKVKGVFDLSGRRLNVITETGIYIVNGKKVVIK